MSVKSIDELRKVIRHNLCNRCGTCVGLSGGKIIFTDKTGRYLPEILEEPDPESADLILQCCSGRKFDFPAHRRLFYDNIPTHTYTGPFLTMYVGYAADENIRRSSASGGILTAILVWLLESGQIDGAVVTRMSHSTPWLPETFIATTREEIIESSQSKYIITSVNEILPQISSFDGKLAYVGLPGQVQSIRLLQSINHPSVRNIRYILGPFYGNTLHFSSIISFLRSYKLNDYRQIRKLYFRYGEWPGNMRVEMDSGETVELPKFHANYLIPFHILKNSLLCTDLSNEFTDISGGDAWAPNYEQRGKGYSMVISRTEQGRSILAGMENRGLLKLNEISLNDAITMHSHGYDLKKRGSFIRIRFRKMLGLPVPDYGYSLKRFPLSRYLMEFVILSLFLVLGTRPARWMVEQLPPGKIGRLFEKSRKTWKKSTYKIKRSNLGS